MNPGRRDDGRWDDDGNLHAYRAEGMMLVFKYILTLCRLGRRGLHYGIQEEVPLQRTGGHGTYTSNRNNIYGSVKRREHTDYFLSYHDIPSS